MSWYVCQIGAREHYAIPRALQQGGGLAGLITDFWVTPSSPLRHLPGGRRLRDRYHPDLAESPVHAPNGPMLLHEVRGRLRKEAGWTGVISRNEEFQKQALRILSAHEAERKGGETPTLFSYSYAARRLFEWARERGWKTVLGQIDPGPEEERIVAEEHERYPDLASSWERAPESYWETWREEVDLAELNNVNSEWSKKCLLKEGIASAKLEVVPLVFDHAQSGTGREASRAGSQESAVGDQASNLKVLFLGQINLRKGIGRLLDAMRLLKDAQVELTLAGPSEIGPSAWSDLPKVRWIGPIPRSAVGSIYREADVFILPTLSDGYALTQLEALGYGLPVIASKHCGEAVTRGNNGWILEDLEPATIAKLLREISPASLEPSANRFGLAELAAFLRK